MPSFYYANNTLSSAVGPLYRLKAESSLFRGEKLRLKDINAKTVALLSLNKLHKIETKDSIGKVLNTTMGVYANTTTVTVIKKGAKNGASTFYHLVWDGSSANITKNVASVAHMDSIGTEQNLCFRIHVSAHEDALFMLSVFLSAMAFNGFFAEKAVDKNLESHLAGTSSRIQVIALC